MTAPLLIQIRKEARPLLPWAAAVAVTIPVLAWLARPLSVLTTQNSSERMAVLMLYAVAVLALAAISMGQEFAHGTLAGLLVQPVARIRVLLTKISVLGVVVGVVGLVARWTFKQYQTSWVVPGDAQNLMLWGPVLAAIGLVPLLTILTRRVLGGIVFSVATLGIVFAIAYKLNPLVPNDNGQLEIASRVWDLTWSGTLLVSMAGLLVLMRSFTALQAAGHGSATSPIRAEAVEDTASHRHRPRHWVWLTLGKEFRLQLMPLVVSGLYAVGYIAIGFARRGNNAYVGPSAEAISILHAAFIPLLIGASTSAEERQMGTLQTQILMPKSSTFQWMIKAGFALGLTVALVVGLGWFLTIIAPQPDRFYIEPALVLTSLLLCSAAIYVSSLCRGSLAALLGSFVAIAASAAIAGVLSFPVKKAAGELTYLLFPTSVPPFQASTVENLAIIGLLVLALIVLAFAGRNHRSPDASPRTVARQVLWLLLFAVVGYSSIVAAETVAGRWGLSAIEGTVTDASGDPVPNVTIQVSQALFYEGRPRLHDAASARVTNDRGQFRIGGLPPGDYYVEALSGAFAKPTAAGGFAVTFFPGTTKASDAQTVNLTLGTETHNVSFSLTPAALASVSGALVDGGGRPLGTSDLTLMPSEAAGAVLDKRLHAVTGLDGQFTFPNLPPGRYTIQAQVGGRRSPRPFAFGYKTFSVDGKNIDGLTVSVPAARTLRGRITFEGDKSMWPKTTSEVFVFTRPINFESAPVGDGPMPSGIRDDWTFEIGAMTGLRIVTAGGSRWTLKKAMLNGQDVTDLPIDLREHDVDKLEIVLTTRVSTVTGTVASADGQLLSNFAVIVFADDETKWTLGSRHVEVTRTNGQGTFTLKRLPAGSFIAVAVSSDLMGQWEDPAFLKKLGASSDAVRFVLSEEGTAVLKVTVRK